MRTVFRGGWIVGHDGASHAIVRDGVCVVEDDRVVHVGGAFDEPADRTIDTTGMLVSPGLITTHVHPSNNTTNFLFRDRGRPHARAANYQNWQMVRRGASRYKPDERASVLFGLGQAVRSGVTTALAIGFRGDAGAHVDVLDELGVRAYTGPAYRNEVFYATDDGRVDHDWSDERGERGLAAALAFAERADGAAGGRIRPLLCPGHPDTCSEDLLRRTAEHARERDLPVTIHAAINLEELQRVRQRYGQTPVELLARVGLLGPRTLLGHTVFLSEHSWAGAGGSDMALLGEHGATVSHSPLKYLHMGAHLESLRRYIDAGINVTMGTDLPPADMVGEMRLAMLMSRVADRSFLSGDPRDVFDAATVNAARALQRPDLGRLAPGCKADVAVFDLRHLSVGAVHDPIRSLIEDSVGLQATSVMVDGRMVVQGGRFVTFDEDEVLTTVQRDGEAMVRDIPNWVWGGRSPEQAVPASYPSLATA